MQDISKFSDNISSTEIIYIKNFLDSSTSSLLSKAIGSILEDASSDSNEFVGYSNDGQVNSKDRPYVFLGQYSDPLVRKAVAQANHKAKFLYEKLYGANAERYFIYFGTVNVMKPGGDMNPHADEEPSLTQNIATPHGLVLYINDDYEGGEIYYPNLQLAIKPKAGSLVIHPGNSTYLHGVSPVTAGIRYVTTAFSKAPLNIV